MTTGNVENIKLEFNKLVEEENKHTSDEGFFANQSTIENNHTNNTNSFQRQKPQRKWVKKHKVSKEISKQADEEVEQVVKINSQAFKDQIEKFSKDNGTSKRQARKKIFWQIVESRKKQNDLTKKTSEKTMSKFVKTMSSTHADNQKNHAQTKKSLSQSVSQNSFSKPKLPNTSSFLQNF